MKKKIIITLSIILPVISIIFVLAKNITNQDKTFYQDGVLIAMTVDGEMVTEFPDYENNDYTVDISCKNAVGKWMPIENDSDYTNGLVLEEITGEVSCHINFTSKTSSDLLKSIVETTGTSGNGAIVNANGYRYTGQEPNNYVWFNNEMWRIIGSIPVCTTASCGTGSNLVKIIRNESIGGLAYDGKSSEHTGAWGNNTLYTLLNSYYYGKKDGTNTAYCYGYRATVNSKCNYTRIGINGNDYYGKMIEEVYWNTGASAVSDAGTVYGTETATQTVKGHIGLMTASDYGYAASSSYHSTSMNSYNTSAISLTNWLYNCGYEWTSIQDSSYTLTTHFVNYPGNVTINSATYGYAVRPVVYLDSLVYVTSGTGTIMDPYMLDLSL